MTEGKKSFILLTEKFNFASVFVIYTFSFQNFAALRNDQSAKA